jgi:anti-sigma regulatory factor (Ser/Thr protein kinase)
MREPQELTFSVVDDLVGAFMRRRLGSTGPEAAYTAGRIGPLIELFFQANAHRFEQLQNSAWIDFVTNADLGAALLSGNSSWLDATRRRGLLRTVFNPQAKEQDIARTGFLIAARRAAEAIGFSIAFAQSMAAAMREMESNVYEHSAENETGVVAYYADRSAFEFVVADAGVGVLATLRDAPEYKNLSDHGLAIHAALQEGTSRYGPGANRGRGFRDLFLGLANLNANLRFRSGDHALTISGPTPTLKTAELAQKSYFQGFLVSVRCDLPHGASVLH